MKIKYSSMAGSAHCTEEIMSACALCPRECLADRGAREKKASVAWMRELSGKSGASYVGGTLYLRNKRLRGSVLFRVRAALLFLPELPDQQRRLWKRYF